MTESNKVKTVETGSLHSFGLLCLGVLFYLNTGENNFSST